MNRIKTNEYGQVIETYYDTGEIRTQNSYKNKKLDGEQKTFTRDGRLEWQESYKDGERHGDMKNWWSNGQLRYRDTYENGKLEGDCFTFTGDGKLVTRTFWRNNLREGECKGWNKIGLTYYHIFYMGGHNVDANFNIFKKNKWVRGLRKWKAKANLHSMGPILDELNIPLDLAKICAQYK